MISLCEPYPSTSSIGVDPLPIHNRDIAEREAEVLPYVAVIVSPR